MQVKLEYYCSIYLSWFGFYFLGREGNKYTNKSKTKNVTDGILQSAMMSSFLLKNRGTQTYSDHPTGALAFAQLQIPMISRTVIPGHDNKL